MTFESFRWTDVTGPTPQLLRQLAVEIDVPERVMLNALDTDYLPQIEIYEKVQFILLRLMEPETKSNHSSVQELTTKVALFICEDRIISIHRLPLIEIEEIKQQIELKKTSTISKQKIISFFYEQASLGFDKPLSDLENKMQQIEQSFFSQNKSKEFLKEGFYLKRKSAAFKKVLKLTLDLLNKLVNKMDCSMVNFQESKDRLERSLFYAEDVYDNIQSLLNLHVSVESQKTNEASFKTNEIVRVLTVLTLFFLPLNFVAGVFGMNFAHIPFLQHEYGFWFSIAAMLGISILLTFYLLKQGWLRRPDITLSKSDKR
jgi:magnesium transporter